MAKQQFRLFDKNGKEQPIDADRIQDELDQMQSIGYQLREVGTCSSSQLKERISERIDEYQVPGRAVRCDVLRDELLGIIDELTVQPRAEDKPK